MFNPSKDEVRQFFCNTWKKSTTGELLTPLEAIARDWILQHPEYESDLADPERALDTDYSIDQGRSNPFLHLSMHLSIHEQMSVDQPPGIREACETLIRRLGSAHEAHHQIMECLGEMLWTAQRNGTPPDGEAYIHRIQQRAGK
jgi:hypothetical protein